MGINVTGMDDIDNDGFNELLIGSSKSSAEQGTVHFVYGILIDNTFRCQSIGAKIFRILNSTVIQAMDLEASNHQ